RRNSRHRQRDGCSLWRGRRSPTRPAELPLKEPAMHAPRTTSPLIELRDVTKVYQTGGTEVRALDGVSLTIRRGEFVAIMGQSGSGKSTLMNILGCLDRPTGGTYKVSGIDVSTLSPDDLAALRRDTFG